MRLVPGPGRGMSEQALGWRGMSWAPAIYFLARWPSNNAISFWEFAQTSDRAVHIFSMNAAFRQNLQCLSLSSLTDLTGPFLLKWSEFYWHWIWTRTDIESTSRSQVACLPPSVLPVWSHASNLLSWFAKVRFLHSEITKLLSIVLLFFFASKLALSFSQQGEPLFHRAVGRSSYLSFILFYFIFFAHTKN